MLRQKSGLLKDLKSRVFRRRKPCSFAQSSGKLPIPQVLNVVVDENMLASNLPFHSFFIVGPGDPTLGFLADSGQPR